MVLIGLVHTKPEGFKNATNTGYFGAGKSRDYRDVMVSEKPFFKKGFPSTLKSTAGVLKFL